MFYAGKYQDGRKKYDQKYDSQIRNLEIFQKVIPDQSYQRQYDRSLNILDIKGTNPGSLNSIAVLNHGKYNQMQSQRQNHVQSSDSLDQLIQNKFYNNNQTDRHSYKRYEPQNYQPQTQRPQQQRQGQNSIHSQQNYNQSIDNVQVGQQNQQQNQIINNQQNIDLNNQYLEDNQDYNYDQQNQMSQRNPSDHLAKNQYNQQNQIQNFEQPNYQKGEKISAYDQLQHNQINNQYLQDNNNNNYEQKYQHKQMNHNGYQDKLNQDQLINNFDQFHHQKYQLQQEQQMPNVRESPSKLLENVPNSSQHLQFYQRSPGKKVPIVKQSTNELYRDIFEKCNNLDGRFQVNRQVKDALFLKEQKNLNYVPSNIDPVNIQYQAQPLHQDEIRRLEMQMNPQKRFGRGIRDINT